MDDMAERLRAAREAAGYEKPVDAATAFGWKRSTYFAHENGQNGFKAAAAKKYAQAFRVSAAWLLTGEGDWPRRVRQPAARQPSAPVIDVPEAETRGGAGAGGIDFEALDAAQNGIAVSADLIRDRWGLPESFLRGTLHISGRAAAIVEIYGDSMYDPSEPGAPGSLHPGDRVIVDLGDRRPSPPGAFLVWDGVGVVVKLLDVVRGSEPAKLRLLSRNPRYEPYDATEDEVRIIGRVRGRISVM
jgi:phage repressor protein C with HTH and peptisase S24 domain